MLTKKELGKIISERFKLRGGKKIYPYLGEWMVDYVFEAIKIALIDDGGVNIRGVFTAERIDVPTHTHKMPDGRDIIIPAKSKVRLKFAPKFLEDVNNDETKETKIYDRK